jgi:hypothetical protein
MSKQLWGKKQNREISAIDSVQKKCKFVVSDFQNNGSPDTDPVFPFINYYKNKVSQGSYTRQRP